MLASYIHWASQVVLVVKNLPASPGDVRDTSSILGSGRSPGGEHGNPLQYSCLENPMERGAWWATVYRVTKSRTWLKQLSSNIHPLACRKAQRHPHWVLSLTGISSWNTIHDNKGRWDFPGSPGAKTLPSQCRGCKFNLWSENWIPHAATKDTQGTAMTWHNQISKFLF